jgi:hypothetical protein
MANLCFTKKNANSTRGKLRQSTIKLWGTLPSVAWATRIATPLAPPMVKLLGEIKQCAATEIKREERRVNATARTHIKTIPFFDVASAEKCSFVILGGR